MQPSEMIWMDGQLVPFADATVHVLAHSLHYGNAVFEGIRAYETPDGPAILQLGPHVHRMFRSCRVLDMEIPFSREEIEKAIVETVRRNGHRSCYIRPLVYRGAGPLGVLPKGNPIQVSIATWEWASLHGDGGLDTGVDVAFSSWRRMAPGTHPSMAKASGNYLNSQLVVQEAQRHGYAEGLVLDVDGYLSEGSGENVFLVQDGKILTPPIGNSILAGITRGMVMEIAGELGVEVREARIPREAVFFCEEMFMTGTAAEITPIRSVDGRTLESEAPGPVTKRLQTEFFARVQGRVPDRSGWLTHVSREGGAEA
ncbi:MAG: branched-chain amino acid transaminase [Planctomycetota bacterium]